MTGSLPKLELLLRSTKRILIASDFDGTLCPIAEHPSAVRLSRPTLYLLSCIAASPRFALAIISGRSLHDLRSHVPLDIFLAGNHGLEIIGPGLAFVHPQAKQLCASISDACAALEPVLAQWPAAFVEHKGLTATLHFRQVDPAHHDDLVLAARRVIGRSGPALSLGKRSLEIHPRVQWDKGAALQLIRDSAGPFDACLCLGDDNTDESMFRANPGPWNIHVGFSDTTAAAHCLSEHARVPPLLREILDLSASAPAWFRAPSIAC